MKKNIRNLLILSTLSTISIYVINKIISVTSCIKNLINTDSGRFYDWRYGKIYYNKRGKGSPILLVHDLNPASSTFEWERIEKRLSKFYTVYTIDLLGCGCSEKPNLTYTNYMYVQLITDFIKNIIGEKTDIISTGMSGSFTVMACNMYSECFGKIILINPEDLTELSKIPGKQKNVLKFLIDFPIIGTLIYNMAFSGKAINTVFYHYYYKKHLIPTQVVDTYYESSHWNNSRGKYLLSSIKAHYTNINIVHALKKINNSIYLICSKENEKSEEIIETYSFYNPAIESVLIKDSKYLPQFETPELLLDQINLFLES